MTHDAPIIEVSHLRTCFGTNEVHKDINFTVKRGEVVGIVGGSGSGKTTILRQLLGLSQPTSGSIRIFGKEIVNIAADDMLAIQRRWGVLFQQNALFSSLTLLENVAFPLRELIHLDTVTIEQLATLKISMVGLSAQDTIKYPAELSGGMQKRAGIARAIVLDPELLFLDEPTAGLDPETAAKFDELILNLQKMMGLTIVMVTHDLDSLWQVADRVAFLGEGTILCIDTMPNLIKNPHPLIQNFFAGPRGRNVQQAHDE